MTDDDQCIAVWLDSWTPLRQLRDLTMQRVVKWSCFRSHKTKIGKQMKTHLAWRWEPGRSTTHPVGRMSQRGLESVRKWTATVQLLPIQRCGRFEKQQQGGFTPAGWVGGDNPHCGWRLSLSLTMRLDYVPALALLCSYGDTWGLFALLHFPLLLILWRPCPQMSIGCQSPHALFNVWTDLNQKQTSSLSVSYIYHRCWSITFSPTLYLSRYARFLLFLNPRHNVFWLPDVFLCSFLWSMGEKQSEYSVRSFLWLFWGAAYCKPGAQVTRRQGRKDMEWKKGKMKSKWSHVLCPRSLGGSFNKRNALNSSWVLLFSV